MTPRRLAALLAVLGLVALLWHERAWFEPATLKTLLADHPWAPAAFVALHVLASLAFIPRTLLALAAGLLFGLEWGIVWSIVGSMAGAWAGFGLARALGADVFSFVKLPRVSPWLDRLERGGWRGVWLIRLAPLPHTPVNYALGLTGIGWSAYTWGSLLGTLPSIVLCAAIGAAGNTALTGSPSQWLVPIAVGVLGLAASVLIPRLPFVRGWLDRKRPGDPPPQVGLGPSPPPHPALSTPRGGEGNS